MDAGNLVYLVAVIVYFIYTALKKNKSEEDFEQPSQPEKPESKKKPVSFEELLKEIRQGQDQREREIAQPTTPSRMPEPTQGSRESRPLEKPKRQTPKPQDKPKEYYTYEGVVEERAAPERVKLADQERLSSHISGIKSSILQEKDKVEVQENRYKQLLSNPKTAKDAIILSEVLTRRYF